MYNVYGYILCHQEYQMKDYPEILTLLLKRFQFDYNRMDYVKIDCYVEVPYTLQTAVLQLLLFTT